MVADDEFEEIPFQLSIDLSGVQSNSSTVNFQWRPDPALYLSVLAGQFELEISDIQIEGTGALVLSVNYQVAGWKSIMGNPDKKRRSRRSNGNSTSQKTTTTTVTRKK
jgi:hypothetical protein